MQLKLRDYCNAIYSKLLSNTLVKCHQKALFPQIHATGAYLAITKSCFMRDISAQLTTKNYYIH